jgi:hypothetical protein
MLSTKKFALLLVAVAAMVALSGGTLHVLNFTW